MRTAIAVGHVRALSMSCYIHPLEQYKATYDVMTRSWPAAALHSMASGVGVLRQSQPLPFLPGGGGSATSEYWKTRIRRCGRGTCYSRKELFAADVAFEVSCNHSVTMHLIFTCESSCWYIMAANLTSPCQQCPSTSPINFIALLKILILTSKVN